MEKMSVISVKTMIIVIISFLSNLLLSSLLLLLSYITPCYKGELI